MGDKVKKRARLLQEMTGMQYSTCRALVLGEQHFTPQSPYCTVAGTLKELLQEEYVQVPGAKPCRCDVCSVASKRGTQ